MTRRMGRLALTALLALNLACASAPKNPNGLAGTTDILSLMRDWRGVWSGGVRDSPIGQLSYTLYIEARSKVVHLRMADAEESGLDDLKNEFALINFERGTPRVRVLLKMRGKTTIQELVYQPERSTDQSASFCLENKGCVFTELVFTRLGKSRVGIRARVEESPYADIEVRFLEREVPKSGVEKERARLTSEPSDDRRDGSIDVEDLEPKKRRADDAAEEDSGEDSEDGDDGWEDASGE